MTRGAFITLEGVEGVGKSTCVSTIETALRESGYTVLVTREPGGTALGEQVREWILDEREGGLSGEIEALLMFAARARHLDRLIAPALAQGRWVVCDRFTDATYAYQHGGRGVDRRSLDALAYMVHPELEPDLTLLLDAPVAVGLQRIQDREHDRFEKENIEFFDRVRAAYTEIADRAPHRVRKIDADQSVEAVTRDILAALLEFRARFDGVEQ
ncbi:dTMP kinase [Candidatus Rariloculus sp.]|uniref:dTMP kinase n=1 Tax=Candidatus Rariloculus sp. TaxID=3101265 RepID=UPI003D0CEBC8